MATSSDLLLDAFGRIRELVPSVLEGLSEEQLAKPVAPTANTIAWLVWHVSRLQDDHIAEVAGVEQLWTRDGWRDRFSLPFDAAAIGYGQTAEEAHRVVAPGELLTGYHAAVSGFVEEYIGGLTDADLDRVVDERWD